MSVTGRGRQVRSIHPKGRSDHMTTNVLFSACLFILFLAAAFADTLNIEGERPFTPTGKPLQGLDITLDPGHGGFAHQPGYTGSARGVNSRIVENDINMLVAAQLRHHLTDAGAQVHLTRQDDRKVASATELSRSEELGARTRIAEQNRSHLFISIHHNASSRSSAHGVMILCWPTDSAGLDQPLERQLADILRDEIEKFVPHNERFDAWENKHPLVAGSDIPSACVEFGFMTNPEFDAWVSQKGSHRYEARGLYEGIVRMWQEHGEELESLRRRLFPDVANTKPRASAAEVINARAEALGVSPLVMKVVSGIWPYKRPPKNEEEVQWLLHRYGREALDDTTFFLFDIKVQREKKKWIVSGATNYGILQEASEQILKAAGLKNIENRVEILPSERLGEKRFGVVQIPMALTWSRPVEGAGVRTQLLLGERVFLLDQTADEGYLLVQGGEGYWGWVRSEAVRRMDEAEFSDWFHARTAVVRRDIMVDDLRLPAGAALPVLEHAESDDSFGTVVLRLPKGVRATKGMGSVKAPVADLHLRDAGTEPPGLRAAKAAAEFLTTPYVFGGRSQLGIDCSGLSGLAWTAAGLTLPRDANQQILVGRTVATPYHLPPLLPGDLVFFCDDAGRVIHSGVSLGGMRYIHASPPEVQINSFDSADPLYSDSWRKHFAFARRPME